jgi:hypothetical protein
MARMTITEAAAAWGVSRAAIYSWIGNGRLTAADVESEETPRGRVWWILRDSIPPHRPEATQPYRRR